MGELANYSIETDQIILLTFKSGRRLRVPVSQLPRYLSTKDLEKIKTAVKLRRDFIRQHMPKAALVLAVGGLLALMAANTQVVARILHRPTPADAPPDQTDIVRSQPAPLVVPGIQASPGPGAKAEPPVVSLPAHRLVRIRIPATPVPLPSASPAPSTPSPTPVPTVTPSPTQAQLGEEGTPGNLHSTNTPGPTPPNQGQVLGDSTGPDATPEPAPLKQP